jgi:signal peptidase II
MEKINLKSTLFFSSFFIDVLVIDQLSKWWATQQGWVTYNSGVSLGWGAELSTLFPVMLLAISAVLFIWFWRMYSPNLPAWGGVFFGGVVSNVLDRFFFSGVRDWLPLPFVNIHNNLADWAICLALTYLFLKQVLRKA